jgi:hypothetical protein
MKILKKILLSLLVIIVLSSFAGYFYFDKKFTPSKNYLNISGVAKGITIKWVSNNDNLYAALLLPVQLKGINKQFYMQLDFGSPITMFYNKSLQSIPPELINHTLLYKNSHQIALNFSLQNMQVSSDIFRVLEYGDKIDFKDPNAENIIGTIGTDLLEKRIIILDFKNGICSLVDKVQYDDFTEFEFKKRRIIFPAKIADENLKLMYDSGTSGYELITSKTEWNKYRMKDSENKTERGNSWGDTLKIISSQTDKLIVFGDTKLKLSEVTYIEGTSIIQYLLMKCSGMQGMVGNKLFLNHILILDCANKRFKVVL